MAANEKPTHLPAGAFYSCSEEVCAEKASFPPYMLWWSPDRQQWFCDSCVEHLELECTLTLEEWLRDNGDRDR